MTMPDRFTEARLHALYQISNAPVRAYPHRHSYVEDVFPADFYAELRRHMPAAEAYTPLAKTGKVAAGDYEMRAGFLPNDEHLSRVAPEIASFWSSLHAELFNQEFVDAILLRHGADIAARLSREGADSKPIVKTDMMLVRDSSSDGVKIHTSDQKNLVTMLFYLPPDERHADCGTTLYLPKARDFRCWGGQHYDFDRFDKVWTAPYRPNALFMFVKENDSFHGVEPIRVDNLRRDLMLFYLHR